MERKGLLLGTDGDLLVEGGALAVGASDSQSVELIVSACKGEFKEFPMLGVGLVNSLKKQSTSVDSLKRDIDINLKADGYKVTGFDMSSGDFNLTFELK